MEQMLAKNTVYPTALVAFNDRLALGAIQAIHQAGLRVPDDISVIGYDNSDQAKYSMPKITTVEIHAPLMAQTASRMLFQQIDDYEVLTVKVLTPVELIRAGQCPAPGIATGLKPRPLPPHSRPGLWYSQTAVPWYRRTGY